ncbi:MAG: 50S ribosomal protein L25 [Acidimicrobiaceae bacterium]|nr:50S ribosomal protein L25 [Acidimicrobiaceae bacterium]
MDEIVLTAATGRTTGTRPSRRLRREGSIPAVVYGLDQDPVSVTVEWTDLRRAITTDAGLNAVIQIDIDGDRHMSLVRDVQRHPVRRDVLHVDFIRIDPDQEVVVDVPIVLVGEADEVTNNDGMVDQNLFALTVSAAPDNIPTEIELDVSALTIGDSLRVADLVLPAGVTTEVDPEDAVAVAMITRSTLEQLAAEEAAAEEAAAAEAAEEGVEGEDGEATEASGDDAAGDDGEAGASDE